MISGADKTIESLIKGIMQNPKNIEKIYVSPTLYDVLLDKAHRENIRYNSDNIDTNESFCISRTMLYNFSSTQIRIVEDYMGVFCKTDFGEMAYKIKYKEIG